MNKQEVIEEIRIRAKYDSEYRTSLIRSNKAIELIKKIDESESRQLDEPQKVKVPQFVAEWIETAKKEKRTLHYSMQDIDDACYYHKGGDPLYRWMFVCDDSSEHQEIFARAWLDGYEVEEEPLFYIRLTIPSSSVVGLYLGFNKDGIFDHSYGKPHVTWDWKCTFTEHEIKSIDERYWPFAVPVEKV